MSNRTHTYFISDVHLGVPSLKASHDRERLLLKFLTEIEHNAKELYIVGDLFDAWIEYKYAVPKGFVRVLGKLAELRDKGLPIHFFTGNHDLWMNGYFQEELDIPVYDEPITITLGDKKVLVGHGDGLGPNDKGYKRMKKIFRNPTCQWLFRQLHPDIGIRLASYFSRRSRYGGGEQLEKFEGAEKEWLYQYCQRKLETEQFDYFVFGHRHLPLDLELKGNSRYINLGDWLHYNTYAVFNGASLELKYYKG